MLQLLLLLLRLLLLLSKVRSPCRDWILRHLVAVLRTGRPEMWRHVAVGIISLWWRSRSRQSQSWRNVGCPICLQERIPCPGDDWPLLRLLLAA
jgi:hypothetical protein